MYLRIAVRCLRAGVIEFRIRICGKNFAEILVNVDVDHVPVIQPSPFEGTYRSKLYPSGLTRCSSLPVAAQVRAILPVFCGISGSTKTI